MSMAGRMEGKVALVTGAARGQGRAHCIRLAEEGADIIAIDICEQIDTVQSFTMGTAAELEETADSVRALGRRVLSRKVDVRDLAALEAVVRDGVAELGRLDTVVANAAIVEWRPAWEFSEQDWQNIVDVNLTGAWKTAKAAIPTMIESGRGGSIAFIASLAASKGFANVGPYVAAKHGLVGLMRTLSIELGPHRIRVNTVNPTNVDTPMIQHETMYGFFVDEGQPPSQEAAIAGLVQYNSIPVPWVDPIDVANAVLYLASDEARYITGVTLPVDGGANCR
jgi:SDR family mycofactocin-dependent oxidoreductase